MRRVLLPLLLAVALVAPLADAATIRRTVPAAGMSIALPSSWRAVDARTVTSAAAQTLAKDNPELATILAQLAQPDSVIKLFAFDTIGAASFATNVNVVVSQVPASVTISQYLAEARREILALPGRVGYASIHGERLPAGQAVRTSVKIGVKRGGKTVVSDITQWAFLRGGKSIVVSFTTTPARKKHYRPIFDAAAHSIRFG